MWILLFSPGSPLVFPASRCLHFNCLVPLLSHDIQVSAISALANIKYSSFPLSHPALKMEVKQSQELCLANRSGCVF